MNLRLPFFILFLYLWSQPSLAQVSPFESEVRQLGTRIDSLGWVPGATVWTGSSTIRLWTSLSKDFPGKSFINTGFGGSKASDLEKYLFPLVIRFEPNEVFIYEGDNDLWTGVAPQEILNSLDRIISRIQLAVPQTKIYLIGAKPSPSRWSKKELYLVFNQQLEKYCQSKEGVTFIATWEPLTDSEGNARPELYIKDQLHLNADGYVVWAKIFKPYLN